MWQRKIDFYMTNVFRCVAVPSLPARGISAHEHQKVLPGTVTEAAASPKAILLFNFSAEEF
jgi:hypothetical protein